MLYIWFSDYYMVTATDSVPFGFLIFAFHVEIEGVSHAVFLETTTQLSLAFLSQI